MMSFAGLQYLAGDVTLAIDAGNSEQPLVVFFTIGFPILGHIFAMQYCLTLCAFEAPNMPMEI